MHIRSRAVTFSLLAGPNPSKQNPNQTDLQALCFHGKAHSAMEALVEDLFDLWKQTTVTLTVET